MKKTAIETEDERIYTPEEGRAAYLRFIEKASKLPGAGAAYQRIKERHQLAVGISKMREHARLTQTEMSRRMRVKRPSVARLERNGATTLQSLVGYARACGFTIHVTAECAVCELALA